MSITFSVSLIEICTTSKWNTITFCTNIHYLMISRIFLQLSCWSWKLQDDWKVFMNIVWFAVISISPSYTETNALSKFSIFTRQIVNVGTFFRLKGWHQFYRGHFMTLNDGVCRFPSLKSCPWFLSCVYNYILLQCVYRISTMQFPLPLSRFLSPHCLLSFSLLPTTWGNSFWRDSIWNTGLHISRAHPVFIPCTLLLLGRCFIDIALECLWLLASVCTCILYVLLVCSFNLLGWVSSCLLLKFNTIKKTLAFFSL